MSLRRLIRPCLLPLPVLALCLLTLACGRRGPNQQNDGTPLADQFTAVEWGRQFRKDPLGTSKNYTSKRVTLTGIVLRTFDKTAGSDLAGVTLLTVDPPKNPVKQGDSLVYAPDGLKQDYDSNDVLYCKFPKEQALVPLSLVTWQQVTIRGTFQSIGGSLRLTEAELVSKGEVPEKEYTLAEVRKILSKKDLGPLTPATPPLILKGVIASIEADKPKPGSYILIAEDASTEPKLTVRMVIPLFRTTPQFADYVKSLKPGNPFRAYGQLRGSGSQWSLAALRQQTTLLLPQK